MNAHAAGLRRAVMVAVVAGTLLVGCSTVQKIGGDIATDRGLISQSQRQSIDRSTGALRESFRDLTPKEEHFVGRAVAADIVSRFPLLDDPELTAYVSRVGHAVAAASTRPETYAGYHFAILRTDDRNAYAAPGGFIFITQGLLASLPDEETLAAVLAHEVAHVAEQHGLQAINKGRLLEAFSIVGTEAGTQLGQRELLELVQIYDGAVGDVVKQVVQRGYDRDQEKAADALAVTFTSAIGYRPDALAHHLDARESGGSTTPGILRSHPTGPERRKALDAALAGVGGGTNPAARNQRFTRAIASLGTP